jgi:hypothetical protein
VAAGVEGEDGEAGAGEQEEVAPHVEPAAVRAVGDHDPRAVAARHEPARQPRLPLRRAAARR